MFCHYSSRPPSLVLLWIVAPLANTFYGLFAFEPHIPVAIVASHRIFTAVLVSTIASRLLSKHSSVQFLCLQSRCCVSDLNNILPAFQPRHIPHRLSCVAPASILLRNLFDNIDFGYDTREQILVLLPLDCCASVRILHRTRLDKLPGKAVMACF